MSFFQRWLGRGGLGNRGERASAKYLRRCGWKIVARNYTCPAGEIDLILDDGATIVFVEVRTRSATDGLDTGSVFPPRKRRQVENVARSWIAAHTHLERAYRFDAILVNPNAAQREQIQHIEEAFRPQRWR